MARLIFTNKAVQDLTEIWDYTCNIWSENQADKYYQLLIDNCSKVADNPDVGKNYPGVLKSLLGLKAGRHIIFYRNTTENEVEIIRILHEQMDVKNRIFEK